MKQENNIINKINNIKGKLALKILVKFTGERKNLRKYITNINWNNIINYINQNNNDKLIYINLLNHVNNELPIQNWILWKDYEEYFTYVIFNKTRKQILINFLQRKGLYNLYKHNISKYEMTWDVNTIDKLIHRVTLINMFQHAFHWSRTEEGYNFWYHKNEEWMKYLNNNITKKAKNIINK